MKAGHVTVVGILLVGALYAAYQSLYRAQHGSVDIAAPGLPPSTTGNRGVDPAIQNGSSTAAAPPAPSGGAATAVPGSPDAATTYGQHRAESVAIEDTPPWPPGTEDRVYQAIAMHLSKYPITGILSVECEQNLCTILLSTPQTDLVDTDAYIGMTHDLRAADLDIGGSSIGVVEYAPGANVVRITIDNIEWTAERLREARRKRGDTSAESGAGAVQQ